jgi:hypothetical protein
MIPLARMFIAPTPTPNNCQEYPAALSAVSLILIFTISPEN